MTVVAISDPDHGLQRLCALVDCLPGAHVGIDTRAEPHALWVDAWSNDGQFVMHADTRLIPDGGAADPVALHDTALACLHALLSYLNDAYETAQAGDV